MRLLLLNHSWLAPELTELGHQVISAGTQTKFLDVNIARHELSYAELLAELPSGFEPECLIYYDDSGIPWLNDLERIDIPKVFFSVDTHHHHGWHRYYAALFDYVLVAQKNHLATFDQNPGKVEWFPPWATRMLAPEKTKDIDVCFRGSLDHELHPKRAAFFAELSAHVAGDFGSGDYAAVYPRAKVVVNETVNGDLNFRVFEGLISGALLVTPDDSPGLTELFADKEDLLIYESNNASSAAAAITWALSHDTDRERIGNSGREKALRFHSSKSRARRLDELLRKPLTRERKAAEHFAAATSYLFAHLVAERQGVSRLTLLEVSADNLLLSLSKNEPVEDSSTISTALHLAAKLLSTAGKKRCRDIFQALLQRYPDSLLAKMALIDSFLQSDDQFAARELASKLSPNVDTLLKEVPLLMERTRQDFFKSAAAETK